MRTIVKSQVAVLVSLFVAIALTLTACGGGSSSSAGGSGSLNAATVAGTVTNNGLARLELGTGRGLVVAVADALVPVARADGVPGVPVTVDCSAFDGDVASTTTNGNGDFSVGVNDVGNGNCVIIVNGVSQSVPLTPGKKTEVEVSLSGGSVTFMSVDQDSSNDFGPDATVAGEIEDDGSSVAAADSISEDGDSEDGESDAASDEDSADQEDEESEDDSDATSDDESSKSESNA
jgi:hypothetical protein